MKTRHLFLGGSGPTGLAAVALCFSQLFSGVRPETVERDFRVGWTYANPDGACNRPVIAVNGEWPLPLITASVGDQLVLHVHNELGNASTSIHFHGFFQNGTNYMDGAVGVTQCGIPPGESFTYEIAVCLSLSLSPFSVTDQPPPS